MTTGAVSRGGPTTGRVRAAFFPRRNRLRRPCDRWETASRWVAVVLLVLLVPVVPAVADARTGAVRAQAAAVRATSYPVDGTVLAVSPPLASRDAEAGDEYTVTVGWTDAAGTPRTGPQVTGGAPPRPGDVWPLRVGPDGTTVPPPATEADAVLEGAVAAVGTVLGWCLAVTGALVLERWLLDRHRMRRWDEDWRTFRRRGTPG